MPIILFCYTVSIKELLVHLAHLFTSNIFSHYLEFAFRFFYFSQLLWFVICDWFYVYMFYFIRQETGIFFKVKLFDMETWYTFFSGVRTEASTYLYNVGGIEGDHKPPRDVPGGHKTPCDVQGVPGGRNWVHKMPRETTFLDGIIVVVIPSLTWSNKVAGIHCSLRRSSIINIYGTPSLIYWNILLIFIDVYEA